MFLLIRENNIKMKKVIKKPVKKTVKPVVVTNLTNVETVNDLYREHIRAKVRAGKPITTEELELAEDYAVTEAIDDLASSVVETFLSIPYTQFEVKDGEKLVFDENGKVSIKKPNIFKRAWNWLRRK